MRAYNFTTFTFTITIFCMAYIAIRSDRCGGERMERCAKECGRAKAIALIEEYAEPCERRDLVVQAIFGDEDPAKYVPSKIPEDAPAAPL